MIEDRLYAECAHTYAPSRREAEAAAITAARQALGDRDAVECYEARDDTWEEAERAAQRAARAVFDLVHTENWRIDLSAARVDTDVVYRIRRVIPGSAPLYLSEHITDHGRRWTSGAPSVGYIAEFDTSVSAHFVAAAYPDCDVVAVKRTDPYGCRRSMPFSEFWQRVPPPLPYCG